MRIPIVRALVSVNQSNSEDKDFQEGAYELQE